MPVEEPLLAEILIPRQRIADLQAPVLKATTAESIVAVTIERAEALGRVVSDVTPIATTVDGVYSLAQWQSPFKNQGDRGTCWAFAGAAALEAAYRRRFGTEIDVSEEFVFHLGKSFALNRDGTPQHNVVQPVENNSSLTGFQGAGDIVEKVSANAVPIEGVAPYLASQQTLVDILPTLGFSGGVGSLVSQEDYDAIEFCEQHIPLLARVNCRYRGTGWTSLGANPGVEVLENTLLSDHEVVCDVTQVSSGGGHVLVLVGFDRNRRVFQAKNSWGENAFIEIQYENDPAWTIRSGWFINDVVDPTFVSNEACWLGNWFVTIAGQTHRMLLRRSDDAVRDIPTRLGSSYLGDGRHDVNGQFSDNGGTVQLFIADGTGPTPPGTLQGTRIDARLDFTDIYNVDGRTAAGEPVTMSRFTTRFAALWEQPNDGLAWQARHGIDAAAYQRTFDELVGQSFRLTSVCGYSEGRGSRFNAVWVQSGGPAWQARHGLSAADYQRTFDELVGQGFRLACVSGYAENGQARYAAIFEQSEGPAWQARHGLSRGQYQQAFDEMAAQGFVLKQVSGYRVGVDVQFAAIWEHAPGAGFAGRHGLTASQHQRAFDELVGQGFRMTGVCGYSDTGIARYASSWRQEPSGAWQARHGLSGEDYQRTFDELAQQGFRPVQVSGYGDGAYPA